MKQLFLVFIGGGIGSMARYLTGRLFTYTAFPVGTLAANFLSCMVFGLVLMFGLEKTNLNPAVRLLLLTGFCGGFSTFSAFTFETVELFKTGSPGLALINILLNISFSISGLFLGMMTFKLF